MQQQIVVMAVLEVQRPRVECFESLLTYRTPQERGSSTGAGTGAGSGTCRRQVVFGEETVGKHKTSSKGMQMDARGLETEVGEAGLTLGQAATHVVPVRKEEGVER